MFIVVEKQFLKMLNDFPFIMHTFERAAGYDLLIKKEAFAMGHAQRVVYILEKVSFIHSIILFTPLLNVEGAFDISFCVFVCVFERERYTQTDIEREYMCVCFCLSVCKYTHFSRISQPIWVKLGQSVHT